MLGVQQNHTYYGKRHHQTRENEDCYLNRKRRCLQNAEHTEMKVGPCQPLETTRPNDLTTEGLENQSTLQHPKMECNLDMSTTYCSRCLSGEPGHINHMQT